MRTNESVSDLGTKIMHPIVQFVYAETDGVKGMDGRPEKGRRIDSPARDSGTPGV